MRFENHGPPGRAAVRTAFHDEQVAGMALMPYPSFVTRRSQGTTHHPTGQVMMKQEAKVPDRRGMTPQPHWE
jgi:hypothetical protein